MGTCCLRSHQLLIQSHHNFIGSSSGYPFPPAVLPRRTTTITTRICCQYDDTGRKPAQQSSSSTGIQLYGEIERILTESVRQSQGGWGSLTDWFEIEGAWVLKPKNGRANSVVHFIGGIFVGAAPQLAYRLFLEHLAEKGVMVIATPYASGFDYFHIADEAQFKFDRALRFLQEPVQNLPTFGMGHSLGSVIHLLIDFSFLYVSPSCILICRRLLQAEITLKQIENLTPPFMKQAFPLIEQLPPLYMDLVNGREDFSPKPEETRRLIRSYYGVSRNLLIKFKDDSIDETSSLAKVLSSESAISSLLDMSIRSLPGDHGLPLQQGLPDVPPAMADAVNRGSELFTNLAVGTPWETVAKEVGNTLGSDNQILRAQASKDLAKLVDVITSWMASNAGPKALRP
ncbi:unnamed protein product [Linum tenue]|uniref:Uncharacterized protein n=1 Tax=Linum tenue TaxID=586396 RepID=A0AAV0QYF2_9ROSI|nr:unnamed protein product [Linum tenue]